LNAQKILSKQSNARDIAMSDFKLFYRAIALKIVWYWYKNRFEDQWNKRPRYVVVGTQPQSSVAFSREII
jgi:hypothetical protein